MGTEEKTLEQNKPKRGSKSASVVATTTAKKEEITKVVQESYQFFNLPIVKTDEECAERLNSYFKLCVDQGQIPTVEDMCLALGTVRRTVWDWENGRHCSPARANMIKKAKEILAGIDAKLVSMGKIPQVTYIFRAKNFFGMKDQQDLVLTPNNPLGAEVPAEEIEKRLLQGTASDFEGGE